MKKYPVLVYIKNNKDPSSFYRIVQYLKNENECGLIKYVKYNSDGIYGWYYDKGVGSSIIKKLLIAIIGTFHEIFYILWDMLFNHSKAVIIGRKIFPRKTTLIGRIILKKYYASRKVYWDFDDNIIFDKEITVVESRLLMHYSDKIIVTNEHLKDTVEQQYQNKVTLLPTTDSEFHDEDIMQMIKRRSENYDQEIILIWTGTKHNLVFVREVLPYLEKAAQKINILTGKKVTLKIICNIPLEPHMGVLNIENIIWTRLAAKEEFYNAHIGIMPLLDTEFTRGKGGFKGVQYISAGVPCILSNVGFNKSVIEDGKGGYLVDLNEVWTDRIVQLSINKETWTLMAAEARKQWESRFNSDINKRFWKDIIREIVETYP